MEEKEKDQVEFTINGNPGQGNTFINIREAGVVNNNPGPVYTTINVNGGGKAEVSSSDDEEAEAAGGKKLTGTTIRQLLKQGLIDKTLPKAEILKYVDAIRPYVKDDKDKLYMHLWGRILEHKAFAIELFDPGNQPCKFNRSLVGNIMHYLDSKDFYKESYNQSEMTRAVARKFDGADNKGVDDPARRGLRGELEKSFSDVIDAILKDLSE